MSYAALTHPTKKKIYRDLLRDLEVLFWDECSPSTKENVIFKTNYRMLFF